MIVVHPFFLLSYYGGIPHMLGWYNISAVTQMYIMDMVPNQMPDKV